MFNFKFFIIASLVITTALSAPTKPPPKSSEYENEMITIENMEKMLKNAGNLFNRNNKNPSDEASAIVNISPTNNLHPPIEEKFNFYLPQYSNEEYLKLDPKSVAMGKFTPPEKSSEPNYYTAKPKKTSKKFIAGTKHVNMKTEKSNTIGSVKHNNEQESRFFYDDSFFGDDSLVPIPDISQFNLGTMNGFIPMIPRRLRDSYEADHAPAVASVSRKIAVPAIEEESHSYEIQKKNRN